MASVSFVAVSKRYNDVVAVDRLDLRCGAGEMLALLGPSGCGKSTTLKMAAGLESPTAGEILFDDKPVSRFAPGERNVAMVFEDYALYPRMTVRGNIAFPLKVRGTPATDAETRIADILDLLHLGPLADLDVKDLSGGAQQRVAIGRALVRDPELILFDEPLSHLDADHKLQLRAEIKRLQKLRHVTSILVTHDQTEAIAMADRIAVMNHGVLQQVGPPHELYDSPSNLFVANFIGEPPMNLAEARWGPDGGLYGDGWSMPRSDKIAAMRHAPAGPAFVMGIRPEHVALAPLGEARSESLEGIIADREPRGDVDVLTVRVAPDRVETGGPAFVAEVSGPSNYALGQRVAISLDAARAHLFDAGTGNALRMAR
jgi:multiple sugar transport system ATP-binding protein